MSTSALELHDAGVLLVDESNLRVPYAKRSPGYALLDGEALLTGTAAMSRARLNPRFVHNRFWSDLNTAPLGRPFAKGVTRADLAHAHLANVWEQAGSGTDEVILVVPGSHSDAQLGLILGIARAAGLPVSGMVDSATAAGVHSWPGSRLLHLDLHLHRAVVTELMQNDEVVRGRVDIGEGSGLIVIQDALARHIAEIFLHETRFDPLHAAETEQRLYDSLPNWLNRLKREDGIAIRLGHSGQEYSVELARNRLVEAVSAVYESIARLVTVLKPAGDATTLLLSHQAAALPGLGARLGEIPNTRLVALPETAVAAGALIDRDRIRASGDELPFMTRLPVRPGFVPGPPDTIVDSKRKPMRHRISVQPTHVLLDGTAHPITEEPLVVGVTLPGGARGIRIDGLVQGISRSHCTIYRKGLEVLVEDHSTHGSYLNGNRVEGRAVLAVGDRLRLGSPGVELQIIRVAETDGPSQG